MESSQKQIDFELEVVCEFCHGKGGWFDPIDGTGLCCPECSGAGYIPTEIGKKVLAMMRHNFEPLYAKMREHD